MDREPLDEPELRESKEDCEEEDCRSCALNDSDEEEMSDFLELRLDSVALDFWRLLRLEERERSFLASFLRDSFFPDEDSFFEEPECRMGADTGVAVAVPCGLVGENNPGAITGGAAAEGLGDATLVREVELSEEDDVDALASRELASSFLERRLLRELPSDFESEEAEEAFDVVEAEVDDVPASPEAWEAGS